MAQVLTMVVARKRFIPQQEFPLIPSYSFSVTPIQPLPAVHSTLNQLAGMLFFSTFVRMRTHTKPKIMVIGLGVRLIVS